MKIISFFGLAALAATFTSTSSYSFLPSPSCHASSSSSRRALLKTLPLSIPLLLPLSSSADEPSLFDQFGTDSKSIKQTPKKTEQVMVPKSAGAIDPNLRANYYYPTARKRYLPRIKKGE